MALILEDASLMEYCSTTWLKILKGVLTWIVLTVQIPLEVAGGKLEFLMTDWKNKMHLNL